MFQSSSSIKVFLRTGFLWTRFRSLALRWVGSGPWGLAGPWSPSLFGPCPGLGRLGSCWSWTMRPRRKTSGSLSRQAAPPTPWNWNRGRLCGNEIFTFQFLPAQIQWYLVFCQIDSSFSYLFIFALIVYYAMMLLKSFIDWCSQLSIKRPA